MGQHRAAGSSVPTTPFSLSMLRCHQPSSGDSIRLAQVVSRRLQAPPALPDCLLGVGRPARDAQLRLPYV